jgi:lactonase
LSRRLEPRACSKHRHAPTRKLTTAIGIACVLAGLCLADATSAQQAPPSAGLAYDAQTRGPVPIPPSERALQTAVATSWFQVSEEGLALEGAVFDHSGNMFFCDVSGRRVLRLTPDRQLSTVVSLDRLAAGGFQVFKGRRTPMFVLRRAS